MTQGPDFASLGLVGAPAAPAEAPRTDEEAAVELMEALNRTITMLKTESAAQQIEVRHLRARMATMETMVSYLAGKDPAIAERMAKMAKAVEDAEKAQNGNVE